MPEFNPLVRVCQLLNRAGAEYLVVGGYACILVGGSDRTAEPVMSDTLGAAPQGAPLLHAKPRPNLYHCRTR